MMIKIQNKQIIVETWEKAEIWNRKINININRNNNSSHANTILQISKAISQHKKIMLNQLKIIRTKLWVSMTSFASAPGMQQWKSWKPKNNKQTQHSSSKTMRKITSKANKLNKINTINKIIKITKISNNSTPGSRNTASSHNILNINNNSTLNSTINRRNQGIRPKKACSASWKSCGASKRWCSPNNNKNRLQPSQTSI